MSFFESINSCLSQYATFSGRASRSEYWFFHLFAALVSCLTLGIAALLLFLPLLAVNVRRLHDIDRSGWWIFIGCIPLVGVIILLIWHCTRGTFGANQYGADPLALPSSERSF